MKPRKVEPGEESHRDIPNQTSDRAIFGFLNNYEDPGDWGKCGYKVIEPQEKLANLSLADIRRDSAKLSKSGDDPFQGQPERLGRHEKY